MEYVVGNDSVCENFFEVGNKGRKCCIVCCLCLGLCGGLMVMFVVVYCVYGGGYEWVIVWWYLCCIWLKLLLSWCIVCFC